MCARVQVCFCVYVYMGVSVCAHSPEVCPSSQHTPDLAVGVWCQASGPESPMPRQGHPCGMPRATVLPSGL